MTPTTIQSDRQRELVRALAAIPHLVLSMRHGAICGCNVHGRVLPLPMAWPADSTHALPPMTEELLAFLPESEPTRTQPAASAPEAPALAKARTGEPLVHLHVDWTRIRYLRIVTAPAPVSRLGCDAKIVLGPEAAESAAALAFLLDRGDLAPLAAFGRDQWHDLLT